MKLRRYKTFSLKFILLPALVYLIYGILYCDFELEIFQSFYEFLMAENEAAWEVVGK